MQGLLNSIIGPQAKQRTGRLPAQLLTGIKLKILIKLNLYLFYWYFQQNQCLNIKKHAVYTMHRLAWGPYDRGAPGQLPGMPIR